MKSNVLTALGAVIGFVSSGIFTYKLLSRHRVTGSFRELYEDNAAAMKGGVSFE